MRAQGGRGKHNKICLRPSADRIVLRLGRREGGEKSNQNAKIMMLFSKTETAKQNQKFPFHFLSAPPTPPAEENKKGKENFWFLIPRPKGADEARRLVLVQISLVKSSDFVQETQRTKHYNLICFVLVIRDLQARPRRLAA